MEEQKFKKLSVWNKSVDFIEQIYRTTQKFPVQETYGLTSQLRRASTSIALNIAEGSGAGSDGEFKRFLNIALRSAMKRSALLRSQGDWDFVPRTKLTR